MFHSKFKFIIVVYFLSKLHKYNKVLSSNNKNLSLGWSRLKNENLDKAANQKSNYTLKRKDENF